LNNPFFEDMKFNAEFHTLQLREQRDLEVKGATQGRLGYVDAKRISGINVLIQSR
jgi:hypothetical protein